MNFFTGNNRREPEMKCTTCGLWLQPGSSHNNEAACVSALVEALRVATTCDGCGNDMGTHCVSCRVKQAALNKGAEIGMGLFTKAQEKLRGQRERRRGND